MIEHVSSPAAFVRGLAGALAPGGLLIISTPNRTPLTRLALVGLAERTGMIPPGTHDWNKFLTPEELTTLLASEGLKVSDIRGIQLSATRGFVLGGSLALDYILTATHA